MVRYRTVSKNPGEEKRDDQEEEPIYGNNREVLMVSKDYRRWNEEVSQDKKNGHMKNHGPLKNIGVSRLRCSLYSKCVYVFFILI